MTTSSTSDNSATSPEPESQPPAGGRSRRISSTTLACAAAIVGAVAAAVLTPLGEHVIKAFLDEPTCPGEACEGKNPQNQGCNEDARTFKPAIGNPALLQLRYSENCQAVWARIERGSPGDLVTAEVTGGAKRTAEIEYGDDKFTSMVRVGNDEFQVTACAVPRAGGESTYQRYCIHATEATAWR
ncbi:DUF2690 domain-containing protein [Streptomyces coeruleorubidus]|uniref:DUF2690 domain-containing protein n=1 Tax=Streptomyces coeruleorubidus TaxID=116188 RepID=UPI00237F78CC|nr:DUF2690 domain-containing protein [Streptomyces coeruleorubidus]WDV53215.1 DUF2690 domain-containing protein [Streptomyces coeruleorubidus]